MAAPCHSLVSLNPLLGRAGTFLRADVNRNVYQLGAFINKLSLAGTTFLKLRTWDQRRTRLISRGGSACTQGSGWEPREWVMSFSAVLWSAWTWDISCRPRLFSLAGVFSGCQPRWDNHGLLERPAPVSRVEVFWASSGFWLGVLGCLWHITFSPSLFLPGCVIGIGVCVSVSETKFQPG